MHSYTLILICTLSHALTCTRLHLHVDSQCLHTHVRACTCSQTLPDTQVHSDTQPASTHSQIHSHTFTHTHFHTHVYYHTCSVMLKVSHAHMHTLTHTHTHTCTHTILLYKPNPHPSAACPSRIAQAWPHLMAALCSLFPLGSIYFS